VAPACSAACYPKTDPSHERKPIMAMDLDDMLQKIKDKQWALVDID
jgi:hypothetical protein